jgi:Fe2+ or Zn2+ uptake regulation protein
VTVLRSAGLSPTGPRRAVYRVLVGRERPVSAAEIYRLLGGAGRQPGLTSVYRVLRAFAAAGIVHVFPGDEQCYRICRPAPHRHLVCESCGRVIERPVAAMRRWLASVTREAGFAPNVERMDVYGICEHCQPDCQPDEIATTRRATLDQRS